VVPAWYPGADNPLQHLLTKYTTWLKSPEKNRQKLLKTHKNVQNVKKVKPKMHAMRGFFLTPLRK
jgi:hypothetical protein